MAFCSLAFPGGAGKISPALKLAIRRRPAAGCFKEEDEQRDRLNYEAAEGLGWERWSSAVDENMDVLRRRMETARMRERWRIRPPPPPPPEEQEEMEDGYGGPPAAGRGAAKRGVRCGAGLPAVAKLVVFSFALPVVGGALCLCLQSLLLHLRGN